MSHNKVNNWRDRQIGSFLNLTGQPTLLTQERIVLDFLKKHKGVRWKWLGDTSKFKTYCGNEIDIVSENHNGIIIFGKILNNLTTKNLVDLIVKLTNGIDYIYVGINRYEIISHTLPFDLPNDIGDSLDVIMRHANPKFKRLHTFPEVTGELMVAAHPMDCYTICK